jgi:hypothetical protein
MINEPLICADFVSRIRADQRFEGRENQRLICHQPNRTITNADEPFGD